MGPMVAYAVLLALSASSSSPLQRFAHGTVEGHIYENETGRPLSPAIVTILETRMEVRTARDGSFRIGSLVPGTYTMKVKCRGYMTRVTRRFEVSSAGEVTFEIRLRKADDAFEVRRAEATRRPGAFAHVMVGLADAHALGGNLVRSAEYFPTRAALL